MKTRNSHGLLQLGREALAYCQCASTSALISGNKALFESVDLIGEKNQVILEITIYVCVPHFYDLSALIGGWSSVSKEDYFQLFTDLLSFERSSLGTSILLLNVYPFDNTGCCG